uniref:Uncharacterized protein n=1 Tax=Panagrolaimus superbus TaxID=310955 RepID=A0A914Y148_9BILA
MSYFNDAPAPHGRIAVCRVYNRQTGLFEIVPASNPPQGEVFFIEAPPPAPMPMNYHGYENVPQMQSPVYPVPMFQNFQYLPQPVMNPMENEYAEPRDRVISFDSVSSIDIQPSAAPQSNEAQSQNGESAEVQEPSTSGSGSVSASTAPSAHENDTAAAQDNIYCREDGPLARHGNETISRRLPSLIQRHASGTQPWVTKILVEQTRIIVSLDTDENIIISCDCINLGRLMCECQAAPAITLESNAFKKQLFFINNETLGNFFKFSKAVYFTGQFAVENLERLVPCLRARKISVHRWTITHAGRLGSITHAGFPATIENLYFDTRGTDNVSFIDNLSRVYKDVYEDVHRGRPFLVNFQLIVDDFCALGDALDAQIERIFRMLKADVPTTAAVLFSIPGDNDIYAELSNLRFLYSHYGPVEALDGTNYLVDYWKKEDGDKTLVFGFKSRRAIPVRPEIITIERR